MFDKATTETRKLSRAQQSLNFVQWSERDNRFKPRPLPSAARRYPLDLTSPHPSFHPPGQHHLRVLHHSTPLSGNNSTMSLLRPSSRLITSPRAHLRIITSPSLTARRNLTSTQTRSAGDHAHEDHYDPPSGWLWGVKPGEKYENEGWENLWYYGFCGTLLFGVVGYCYKPDTRYESVEMSQWCAC